MNLFKNPILSTLALLMLTLVLFYFGVQYLGKAPNNKSDFRVLLTDQPLEFTTHAKCRMNCRNISKEEINEILLEGKLNQYKTRLNDKPCPSYAVEGRTKDNQQVRIVFGDCATNTPVITAIDLGKNWDCHCR